MKALLVSLLLSFAAQGQEVVILVRHAEKLDSSKDTKLSPKGEERAKALAAKLKDAGITAIYTSEFRRTQETAKPLADALGLTLKIHPANDSAGLAKLLRQEKRVLVVGHSNTVPEIARFFLQKVDDLREDEFDWLFVLVPSSDPNFMNGSTLLKLRQ